MKLAVISDIHGNVPALESVLDDIERWQADKLVINGDVINRGPCSLKVLELLRDFQGDKTYIKGNHEDFVIFSKANPVQKHEYNYHLRCFAQWTAEQVGNHWLDIITTWKDNYDYTLPHSNHSIHITHGSRMGNRDGIHVKLSEEELKNKKVHHSDVFISSHTHLSMVKYLDQTLIMNSGSVGQPLDGDDRAAYARLYLKSDDLVGEITRVKYNKPQALKDFYDSGFMEHGGPVCELILLELKNNKRCVGPFMRQYLDAIHAQKISVEDAVRQYIQKLN